VFLLLFSAIETQQKPYYQFFGFEKRYFFHSKEKFQSIVSIIL